MIPLKDDNPTTRTPVITILLIAACVVVFVFVQPRDSGVQDARFTYAHAAIPCEITTGHPLTIEDLRARDAANSADTCSRDNTGTPVFPSKSVWLAVFYSMFLHGSWLHLGGNMLFLWIFGNNIEDREGKITYLLFYLLAGLVATGAQVAVGPSSTVPMVGASGAIAGVMGAYLVLYPNVRIRTLFIFFLILIRDVQAKWLLLFWFALQFFTSPSSGVAWMAHVGGFAFGVVAGLVWKSMGRSDTEPAPYPAF